MRKAAGFALGRLTLQPFIFTNYLNVITGSITTMPTVFARRAWRKSLVKLELWRENKYGCERKGLTCGFTEQFGEKYFGGGDRSGLRPWTWRGGASGIRYVFNAGVFSRRKIRIASMNSHKPSRNMRVAPRSPPSK